MENTNEIPANSAANKARAWLYLCTILRNYQQYFGAETFNQSIEEMRAFFDSIDDFSRFTAELIRSEIDIVLSTLHFIIPKSHTDDNEPLKALNMFITRYTILIPRASDDAVNKKLKTRLEKLSNMTDQSLAEIPGIGENFIFLPENEAEPATDFSVNLRLFDKLADNVYLGYLPKRDDEGCVEQYFNAMLRIRPDHNKDEPMLLSVLSIGKDPVNDRTFEQQFEKLKSRKGVYEISGTMPSFVKQSKKYFELLHSSLENQLGKKDGSNNDSRVYEVRDTLTKDQVRYGTVKFYHIDDETPAKDRQAIIYRLWLLSQTETISIQVPDKKNPTDSLKAIEVALTISLLNEWLENGFPVDREQARETLTSLCHKNKRFQDIANKVGQNRVDSSITKIVDDAFTIAQQTTVLQQIQCLHRQEDPIVIKVDPLLQAPSFTGPLQSYIDQKKKHAKKVTSKLSRTITSKNKAKFAETDYHTINKSPVFKEFLFKRLLGQNPHEDTLPIYMEDDQKVKTVDADISAKQLAKFIVALEGCLSNGVLYIERKKKGAQLTLKQGDAVGAMKKCRDEAHTHLPTIQLEDKAEITEEANEKETAKPYLSRFRTSDKKEHDKKDKQEEQEVDVDDENTHQGVFDYSKVRDQRAVPAFPPKIDPNVIASLANERQKWNKDEQSQQATQVSTNTIKNS